MLGTSFPGSGQKVNDINLKLLRGGKAFSWSKNNNFINAPRIKSEMTLELLKQLNQVKQGQILYRKRLRKIVIWGVILVISIASTVLAII